MADSRKPRGVHYGVERDAIPVRVPSEHKAHFKQLAASEGISLSNWVTEKLAAATGLPVPDYITKQRERKSA